MLTSTIKLRSKDTLLVKGAAAIQVLGGSASSLGVAIKPGSHLKVWRGKIQPFETVEGGVEVKVSLGAGGAYEIVSGSVGTKIWSSVVDEILQTHKEKWRSVTVGSTDSGKTTFTTFLANVCIQRGLKVGIVDADLGQSDLGPPGSVAATVVAKSFLDLRSLSSVYFSFIGFTSPRDVWRTLLGEVEKGGAYLDSYGVSVWMVNTDGLMTADGLDYKAELVRRVNPDFAVCMKGDSEANICDSFRDRVGCRLFAADSPVGVSKLRGDRARRRLAQYRRFLRGSRQVKTGLSKVAAQFLSTRYDRNVGQQLGDLSKEDERGNRLAFRHGSDVICRKLEEEHSDTFFSFGSLRGMFVGLALEGRTRGFGVISEADPYGNVTVLTRWREGFDTVQLGSIRLSRDLRREFTIPYIRQ
ncbi:MAG: hypothetical protein HYU39_06385 [Thaumarchaeota archaeon]|nr:hypothetical protein [Nitrososphaerota archaeon]